MELARTLRRIEHANYRKFRATLEFRGIRGIVAIEYLDALKEMGWIKIEKGDIVWNHDLDDESSRYLDSRPS